MSAEINRNKEYYSLLYDEIIIPEISAVAHPKGAIYQRNKWMVEKSDYIISGVYRSFGGAYTAVDYAKKLNKTVIDLDKDT